MCGYVFLSHSGQDRAYVATLADHLIRESVPAWYADNLDPGDQFEAMIRAKIDECKAFVVVLTPAAIASRWVTGEIMYALDAHKPIIALRLATCELPVPLRGYHYEDVRGGKLPSTRCLLRLSALVQADASTTQRLATVTEASGREQPRQPVRAAEIEERGGQAPPEAPAVRAKGHPTRPPFTDEWSGRVVGAALRVAFAGHSRAIYAITISPDGTWFATASEDRTIGLWDAHAWSSSPTRRAALAGHTDRVTAVTMTSDASWLASSSHDGRVRLWDPARGICHATLPVGRTSFLAMADSSTLFTAADTEIRSWDLRSRRLTESMAVPGTADRRPVISALAVSRDGNRLLTGDESGAVHIWDSHSAKLRRTVRGDGAPVTAITISPDGARFAVTFDDGTLRVWGVDDGDVAAIFMGHGSPKEPWSPPVAPYEYLFSQNGHEPVWAVAIAPDATWVATGENDRMARIWETSTGDVRAQLRRPPRRTDKRAGTLAVAVAPEGTWLATGDSDGTVSIWDVTRADHG
jgi:TIR domain/WD domain, G-beta repeat